MIQIKMLSAEREKKIFSGNSLSYPTSCLAKSAKKTVKFKRNQTGSSHFGTVS